MAIAKKLEDESSRSSPSSPSSSLNEALLVSTMCIIGSQVYVHVKDGSVFSGIFYTISVENDFGIVLKNAKLTKKGTSKSNVASGKIVETLVILSSNIVQIVAEGASLPSNVAGNIEGENVQSAMVDFPSEPRLCIANKPTKSGIDRRGTNHRRNSAKLESRLENKVRALTFGKDEEPRGHSPNCTAGAMKEPGTRDETGVAQNKHHPSSLNHVRQAGTRILKHSKQNTDFRQEDHVDTQSSSSSLDSISERVKPIEQEKIGQELSSNGFHDAAERPSSTENSSSQSTALDESSEISQVSVAPTQATDPEKKAKGFKLNPEAKIFSPSLTKRLSSTESGMAPVVANMSYVPSNTPMLPVPVQPEIGINPFLSHASSPSKFAPYTNLVAGNVGVGSHFPQHMVGPAINRGQPHRFTSQYNPVEAAPVLVHPNPQVMVGRSGQLMYMQPISQDLVQGAPYHSQLPPRPLFAAQQLPYPKQQSLVATGQPMQLYAPQPFIANGHHQPYTVMPSDIPVMQPPFPTNRPMPIPVPNVFFGTKFL